MCPSFCDPCSMACCWLMLTSGQQPAQLQCLKPTPSIIISGAACCLQLSPRMGTAHVRSVGLLHPAVPGQILLKPHSLLDPEAMPLTHRLCISALTSGRPAAAQGCLAQSTPTGTPGFYSGTVH